MLIIQAQPPRRLFIEILVVIVTVIALYMLLSLVTFNPADPSWSQTGWHEPVLNLGGYFGAVLADIFFFIFGVVAYLIPFILLLFCGQSICYLIKSSRPFSFHPLTLSLIGIVLFIISTCTLADININDMFYYSSGGIIGYILHQYWMSSFGYLGTTLLSLAIWFISITLLTRVSWLTIAEKLGLWVVLICCWGWSYVQRKPRPRGDNMAMAEDEDRLLMIRPDMEMGTALTESMVVEPGIDENQLPLAMEFEPQKGRVFIDESQLSLPNEAPKTYIDEEDAPIDTNYPPSYRFLGKMDDDLSTKATIADSYYQPEALSMSQENEYPKAIELDVDTKSLPIDQAPIDSNEPFESFYITQEEPVLSSIPTIKPILEAEASWQDDDPSIEEAHEALWLDTVSEGDIQHRQHNDDEESEHDGALFTVEDEYDALHTVRQDELYQAAIVEDDMESDDPLGFIHPFLRQPEVPRQKSTTLLPSLGLLSSPQQTEVPIDHAYLKMMADKIERALADYRVKVKVEDYFQGPVVILYELSLAPGLKASRISILAKDLSRSLAVSSVRVEESIPGRPYVGLELPNPQRQTVYIRDVLASQAFKEAKSPLTVVLGKNIAGNPVVTDLAKTPHLLVAGTTGSGKSVGINVMLISMLYKAKPEEVRFIMIDPKMLELSVYEGIPHLLTEVVTDMKDAANALRWCVGEMERRYKLMAALGVRNLAGYNERIEMAERMGQPVPDPFWKPNESMLSERPYLEKLPYIVVVVDEFADLIMAVGKKVEELIARLAQKARAAGIHLVLATQRPSVDVITGLIKANIPTRIAFTVSSKIDSRTILDQMGAESLLGMGDMLFLPPSSSTPIRVHGAFVRDEEVHAVVMDWKARGKPQYIDGITEDTEEKSEDQGGQNNDNDIDPLFDQAVEFIIEKRRVSISSVQRQFRIGYNRAARIVEQMEMQGIISSPNHSGNREILARARDDY